MVFYGNCIGITNKRRTAFSKNTTHSFSFSLCLA
jgi:hypothetical protein